MIDQNVSSPAKSLFWCYDCENKIETKKFIACIKSFAGKDESHIEKRSKIKSVQKENYWQGFTLMTDMIIYKTVSLLLFLL